MSGPETTTVEIDVFRTRTRRKGSGPSLGFLAGFGGFPRWMPFAGRLAERREVVLPSLPDGDRGHSVSDNHLDWFSATRRLLDAAGLTAPASPNSTARTRPRAPCSTG